MANTLYGKGKEHYANGDIDFDTDDIKACLAATATYTPNFSTDEFLDDVSGIPSGGTSGNLAGKTIALGVHDCTDFSFAAVSATTACALIIYKDTGDAATSPLIAYFDTGTGLTVTPNGGQINIAVHASGLFAL